MQTVGGFLKQGAMDLLGAAQVIRLPAHLALVTQNRRAAEGIARMQWQSVIEHMQDFHYAAARWSSMPSTCCKKASNINKVHNATE